MKNLFRRKKPIEIEIVGTEKLSNTTSKDKGKTTSTVKSSSKRGDASIKIIGTQRLTDEQLRETVNVLANELAERTTPRYVGQAKEYLQRGELDKAVFILRQGLSETRDEQTRIELQTELELTLAKLDDQIYFQEQITNARLAKLFFGESGFELEKDTPRDPNHKRLGLELEMRCKNEEVKQIIDKTHDSSGVFYCYCLQQENDSLNLGDLSNMAENLANHETADSGINFIVCTNIDPDSTLHLYILQIRNNHVIIPLLRDELRNVIRRGNTRTYLAEQIRNGAGNKRKFMTTNHVTSSAEFFGRREHLDQLRNAVNEQQSFCLLGLPSIGKSSLIYKLHLLNAFNKNLMAIIQMESLQMSEDFHQIYIELLRQWESELKLNFPAAYEHIAKKIGGTTAGSDRLNHFLTELEEAGKQKPLGLRCLAILDDVNFLFDIDRDFEKNAWDRGVGRLLIFLQNKRRLVTTGITLWRFDTLDQIDFQSGGKYTRITLPPLTQDEMGTMVQSIGGTIGMKFDEESIRLLWQTCGGHPFWTRMLCDYISSQRPSAKNSIEVGARHVHEATQKFLLEQRPAAIKRMLHELTVKEREVLKQICYGHQPIDKAALNRLETYGLVQPGLRGANELRIGILKEEFS